VEARAEVAVAVERVRVEALKAERQAVAAARQIEQSEAVRLINQRIVAHKQKMDALRGEAARLTAELAADMRRCSAEPSL
jgi:septal ring factor EnvC (AmiA/AmiB activator)